MAEIIQRSFTKGELSPALHARADLRLYATGLKTCTNFFVHPEGGASTRAGFKHVGDVKDNEDVVRTIPFQFNTEQTYMLEFTDVAMRVIKDGGYVTETAVNVSGVTQANPAVVTATAHGYSNGDMVYLNDLGGMLQLNNGWFTIANVTPNTFELSGVDSTGYDAYTSGGTSAKVYTVVSPCAEADIPNIKHVQSADVMTITHEDYDTYELSRTGHDAWSFDMVDYSVSIAAPVLTSASTMSITGVASNGAGPQYTIHTVTVASTTGLTVGQNVAISGLVGNRYLEALNGRSYAIHNITATTFDITLLLNGAASYTSGGTVTYGGSLSIVGSSPGGTYTRSYSYVVTAVADSGEESLASPSASITTNTLDAARGVKITWATVTDAVKYNVYKATSANAGVFGWIGSSATNEFEDFNLGPVTDDTPADDNHPFFDDGNKPSTANYYQQRMIYAATANKPQTIFASQSGNYKSMRKSSPLKDDDYIEATMANREVNEIRHLVALDALIVLTSGGEWKVTEGEDDVLTPSTVGFRPQSYYGASHVAPVVVGNTAIYIQERGSRVRDISYTFETDAYSGSDLSILAQHLFEGKTITDMAYAQEPYSQLFLLRSDGVLLGCTFHKDHDVIAWYKFETDGTFLSIGVIAEGMTDVLYAAVERTIDGNPKRTIERLEERDWALAEDAFCVDCGSTYSGTAATVISGLRHLEGEDVVALADGNVVRGLTVSDGQITLPTAASKVHIGLSYNCDLETLPIDSGNRMVRGKLKSVGSTVFKFKDSRGGYIGNTVSNLVEFKPRNAADAYGSIALHSEEWRAAAPPGWTQDGQVLFRQSDPLPATILAIAPEVDIG